MADVQKTIEIIFGATNEMGTGVGSVSASLADIDGSARALAQPFADITSNILAVDAALITVGAGLTVFAINAAGNFTDGLSTLGALFNGTEAEIEELGAALLEFSRDSVFEMEQINQAAFTAISTGTSWQDISDFLLSAQQLAVAGNTGLDIATAGLTRSMNAYGASTDEANRYAEALFTTAQQGDTNLGLLANAIGLVAADAAASGTSIETLGAAVATLTVAGVSTNTAMTLMKSLFKELLKPNEDLKLAMGDVTLSGDGLKAVLDKIITATGGSADAMIQLFGSQEAYTAALIVGKDAAGTFAGTMTELMDDFDAVAYNYDLMITKFDLVNQGFKNSMTAAFIDFGQPLLADYGASINDLSSIVDSVAFSFTEGTFSGVTGPLGDFLEKIKTNIGNIAENIDEALELVDFDELGESLDDLFGSVGEIFTDIFGDIDTSKPEDLADAIQKSVNLLKSLVDVTKGIVDYFKPIYQAIGEASKIISESKTEQDIATGTFLARMTTLANFGTLALGFMETLNNSSVSMTTIFDGISGAVGIVINTIQTLFHTLVLMMAETNLLLLEALDVVAFGDFGQYVDDSIADMENLIVKEKALALQNSGELVGSFETLGNALIAVGTGSETAAGQMETVGDSAETAAGKAEAAKANWEELLGAVVPGYSYTDAEGTIWGLVGTTLTDLSAAADTAGVDIVELKGNITEVGAEGGTAATEITELVDAANAAGAGMEVLKDGADGAAAPITDAAVAADLMETATTGMEGELILAANAFGGVKTASDDTETSLEETTTAADDLYVKLLAIESDERIKGMEANVELNIAQIEADTEKALAAFESINTGITSTGEVITEALGILGGLEANSRVYNDILSIVEAEYELRVASFEATRDYTKALTANLIEKTKALAGGLKIEITADGMEHEIEAFMFQIIKRIHAKALGDEAEFLLSIPG